MDQGRAWRQEGQLLQGEGFRRDWRSGPLVREQADALQSVAGAARSLLEEAPVCSQNASALATRSAEDHAIMSKSVPLCSDVCNPYRDKSDKTA